MISSICSRYTSISKSLPRRGLTLIALGLIALGILAAVAYAKVNNPDPLHFFKEAIYQSTWGFRATWMVVTLAGFYLLLPKSDKGLSSGLEEFYDLATHPALRISWSIWLSGVILAIIAIIAKGDPFAYIQLSESRTCIALIGASAFTAYMLFGKYRLAS